MTKKKDFIDFEEWPEWCDEIDLGIVSMIVEDDFDLDELINDSDLQAERHQSESVTKHHRQHLLNS